MITNTNKLFIIAVLFVFAATCSHNEADQEGRAIGADTPVPQVLKPGGEPDPNRIILWTINTR